jgi:hypothetical protein
MKRWPTPAPTTVAATRKITCRPQQQESAACICQSQLCAVGRTATTQLPPAHGIMHADVCAGQASRAFPWHACGPTADRKACRFSVPYHLHTGLHALPHGEDQGHEAKHEDGGTVALQDEHSRTQPTQQAPVSTTGAHPHSIAGAARALELPRRLQGHFAPASSHVCVASSPLAIDGLCNNRSRRHHAEGQHIACKPCPGLTPRKFS